jgi:Family of unknown function (DUF5995)
MPSQVGTIEQLLKRMDALGADLEADRDTGRFFLATYTRTTRAVAAALADGRFEDPPWVEEWDVVFADLYLDALEAYRRSPDEAPRPWRIAFDADPSLPPVAHVLLGINAHINYDLPQALLAVVPPEDFRNPQVLDRRRRDHERIDAVLADRVAAEDGELEQAAGGGRTLLDRAMTPLNREASRRFLRDARVKVWHNTVALNEARLHGPQSYAERLRDLDTLSSAKVADLLRPGPVLVRLAVVGFGVTLPPG